MRLEKKIITILFIAWFGFTNAQTRIYNFIATNLTDSVKLNFTISAGPSCAGYQVLRGSDSLALYPIYAYPGICGNTSFSESHAYTDFGPNRATPNFYQIHIPPSDYSVIKRIDLAANFSNLLIFPQPVEDLLNIAIVNKKNYYYEINIYDRFGRKRGFSSGNVVDKIEIDVRNLIEGVYVFYIVMPDGNAYRGKFLKKPVE